MKLGEVTNYNLKSQTILAEGWQDLNEAQRIYVGKWEREVWPLVESINTLFEAELTAKQIDGIFGNAEKVAIDSGDNKTALGKAGAVVGDQAKKLQKQIDDLLKAAQNSGPVKNFDAHKVVFFGDKTMPGGNDYSIAAKLEREGGKVIQVNSWEDTYKCLQKIQNVV